MENEPLATIGLPAAKQQRAQSTIDQVLAETCRVLAQSGEGKVRVQEISSATSVSIGSIYHHFGNREGLVLAAYVENFTIGFRRNLEITIDWLNSITDIRQLVEETVGIRKMVDGYFSETRAIDQVAILGSTVGRPKLKAALTLVQTDLISRFEVSVERLKTLGFVKSNISARGIAVMVLGMVIGHAVNELDDAPISSAEWNQVLLEMLSGLIPTELLVSA
jgi:AcrR family transcriptional regulator